MSEESTDQRIDHAIFLAEDIARRVWEGQSPETRQDAEYLIRLTDRAVAIYCAGLMGGHIGWH